VNSSIAILFRRFGPYHQARLRAAGRVADVVGIEVAAADTTYQWNLVKGADAYKRETLFADPNGRPPRPRQVATRVARCLEWYRPMAVAVPGWSSPSAFATLSWCADTGTPAILMSESQTHDYRRRWWQEKVKRRVVRLFSAALVGGKTQAAYAAQLGLDEERIFPGYDVVDNAHFAKGAARARRAPSLRAELKVVRRVLSDQEPLYREEEPAEIAARLHALSHAGRQQPVGLRAARGRTPQGRD